MSLLGKPVCDVFGGNFRYGFVEAEEIKDKWKYVTVTWINDETYINRMEDLKSLRAGDEDFMRYVYRTDQIKFIDLEKQIKDLRVLKKRMKEKKND